jgi:hypothetical protein
MTPQQAVDLMFNEAQQEAQRHERRQQDLQVSIDKLVALCTELDEELDGVKLPSSAAAIMNSIRSVLADMVDD